MATIHESFLIADTSGLISLAVKTDSNHEPALSAAERLQGKQSTILVPYEVLVETVNVLGKRLGHAFARAVASYLDTTPVFLLIDSSKQAREFALQRFGLAPVQWTVGGLGFSLRLGLSFRMPWVRDSRGRNGADADCTSPR